MADVFTVEMGEYKYSVVAPDGVPGEPVEYESTATIMWNGVLYYCHIDDPDKYPEDGDPPEVHRVDATTVVESKMEEVSDEDQEQGQESEQEDEEEEDEEDEDEEDEDEEDEDEEDEEPGPGEVYEFPAPEEEDEDENLPPAEQG